MRTTNYRIILTFYFCHFGNSYKKIMTPFLCKIQWRTIFFEKFSFVPNISWDFWKNWFFLEGVEDVSSSGKGLEARGFLDSFQSAMSIIIQSPVPKCFKEMHFRYSIDAVYCAARGSWWAKMAEPWKLFLDLVEWGTGKFISKMAPILGVIAPTKLFKLSFHPPLPCIVQSTRISVRRFTMVSGE